MMAKSTHELLKTLSLIAKALKAYEVEDKCVTVLGKEKFINERGFHGLERFFSSCFSVGLANIYCIQTFELEYMTHDENGVAIRVVKRLHFPINKEDYEGNEMDMPEVGSLEDTDVILVRGIPTSGIDKIFLNKCRMIMSRNLEHLPKRLSDLRRNGTAAYFCAICCFVITYICFDFGLLALIALSLHTFSVAAMGKISVSIVDKCWADASDEEIERFFLETKAPLETLWRCPPFPFATLTWTSMTIDNSEDRAVRSGFVRAGSSEAFKDEEVCSKTTGTLSTVASTCTDIV
jgi:hypothetical protein